MSKLNGTPDFSEISSFIRMVPDISVIIIVWGINGSENSIFNIPIVGFG